MPKIWLNNRRSPGLPCQGKILIRCCGQAKILVTLHLETVYRLLLAVPLPSLG